MGLVALYFIAFPSQQQASKSPCRLRLNRPDNCIRRGRAHDECLIET